MPAPFIAQVVGVNGTISQGEAMHQSKGCRAVLSACEVGKVAASGAGIPDHVDIFAHPSPQWVESVRMRLSRCTWPSPEA